MKKKLGSLIYIIERTYPKGEKFTTDTPVWITFYTYKDKLFSSIYFTKDHSPRDNDWFKELQGYGFKIIPKGSWRFGYYYKIIMSDLMDNMIDKVNKLKDWENDNHKFEFKFDVDEIYSRTILEKL